MGSRRDEKQQTSVRRGARKSRAGRVDVVDPDEVFEKKPRRVDASHTASRMGKAASRPRRRGRARKPGCCTPGVTVAGITAPRARGGKRERVGRGRRGRRGGEPGRRRVRERRRTSGGGARRDRARRIRLAHVRGVAPRRRRRGGAPRRRARRVLSPRHLRGVFAPRGDAPPRGPRESLPVLRRARDGAPRARSALPRGRPPRAPVRAPDDEIHRTHPQTTRGDVARVRRTTQL